MPMSKATRFISLPEAGRRLGKSPRSVKRLIATGKLQAISIPGTHARVSLDQVESYVPAKLRGRRDLRAGAAGRAAHTRLKEASRAPSPSPRRTTPAARLPTVAPVPLAAGRGGPSPRSSPRSSRIRPRS